MLVLGGTLIDTAAGGVIHDSGIRIEGDRILTVGRRPDFGHPPSGEPVVDASGAFVLPGLIDMHLHISASWFEGDPVKVLNAPVQKATIRAVRTAAVSLAKGVTTARDLGGASDVPLHIRDAIANREIPGPRLFVCGCPVSVTGGHASFMQEADGADGFRAAARRQLKVGVDFIKVMASHEPWSMPGIEQVRIEATSEEMTAAFDEAHQWGKLAGCHATGTAAITRALRAGVDLLEHGHYLTDELASEMAARGVVFTPTLSTYDVEIMNPRVSHLEPWAVAYQPLVEGHKAGFRAALKAGVTMTVGTDTFGIYAEEVALMRMMGMSAHDSLRACTINAARALRMEADIGTIESGKIADLVILRTDPLADPWALDDVTLVVKDGMSYTPTELTFFDRVTTRPTMMDLASRDQRDP